MFFFFLIVSGLNAWSPSYFHFMLKKRNEIVIKKEWGKNKLINKTTVIMAWGYVALCPTKGKGFGLSIVGINSKQTPLFLWLIKHWIQVEVIEYITYSIFVYIASSTSSALWNLNGCWRRKTHHVYYLELYNDVMKLIKGKSAFLNSSEFSIFCFGSVHCWAFLHGVAVGAVKFTYDGKCIAAILNVPFSLLLLLINHRCWYRAEYAT